MLIVKVFVNKKQIDEIKIQNVSPIGHIGDFHDYKIIKPQGEDIVIKHLRSSGWMPLVGTVLEWLTRKK